MFQFSFSKPTSQRGFSFVEMLMILTLLTVVSMPMIMSMNAQNRELRRSDSRTSGNMAIDKLFDVVDPNIPRLNTTEFTTGCQQTPNGWTCATAASVFCDPLSPAQDTNRCNQGPYFFRRYQVNPINDKLVVEVGIGNDLNLTQGTGTVTIYRRRYEMNSYRVFPTGNASAPLVGEDGIGQAWYREAVTDNSTDAPMHYAQGNGCDNLLANASNPITHRYVKYLNSSCAPSYHFRVEPGVNYELSTYFVNRSGAPGFCSAGADERTKHNVTIQVRDNRFNLITEKRNIDIGAKVNSSVNGQTSESLYFQVPRGAASTPEIVVQPSAAAGCPGSYGELSAIELNKL